MDPSISIVIPFFNAGNTLSRAVKSILNQEGVDWELILVNDGSKDNSEKIAYDYLIDSRIKLLSQENKGVSVARNFGASFSKGNWLLFLDADDSFRVGILEKMEEMIKKYPDCDYFHFGYCKKTKLESIERIPDKSTYVGKLAGSFLLKKSVFDKVGGYDENLKFSENTELFHRIQLEKAIFRTIPWVSLDYYESSSGGSKNTTNILNGVLYILNKHNQTLNSHVKYLYHQSAGVIFIRFRDFNSARFHLFQAIRFKPWKLTTLIRYTLTYFKPVAKLIYKKEVKFG